MSDKNKWKFKGGMGYLHTFKIPPQKIPINYRGINDNFTVEKPGNYSLNQIIRIMEEMKSYKYMGMEGEL